MPHNCGLDHVKGLITLIGGFRVLKIVLLSSLFGIHSNWSNYTRMGPPTPNQGSIWLKLMLAEVYNVSVHSNLPPMREGIIAKIHHTLKWYEIWS